MNEWITRYVDGQIDRWIHSLVNKNRIDGCLDR